MNRLVLSKLLALAVGIGCVFFAFKYNKNALYETSGSIYGTYWKLVSTEYIPDPLIQSIKQELNRIDFIASNYKPSSELSIINAAPVNTEIAISSDMYTILKFAEDLHQLSNGYYDVTIGSLIIKEGFGPESPMTDNAIPVSKKRFNFLENNSITKNDNFQFDLSSIAKGYAVDLISNLLIRANRNNYLIDIGGEIIVNGSKHGEPWTVGIQNPSAINNQSDTQIRSSKFLAIATSGEYRNFKLNDNGSITSHTFIPEIQQSLIDKSYSVTVVSEKSSMSADAWATALNALGPNKGIKVANEHNIPVMYIMQENNIMIKSNYWNYND